MGWLPWCWWWCGGVLLSRRVAPAVPSALAGLASGFGMGTGRFPAAMAAATVWNRANRPTPSPLGGGWGCGWGFVNRIVDASALTRGVSMPGVSRDSSSVVLLVLCVGG